MQEQAYEIFRAQLAAMRENGTYKDERIITTPQQARVDTIRPSRSTETRSHWPKISDIL